MVKSGSDPLFKTYKNPINRLRLNLAFKRLEKDIFRLKPSASDDELFDFLFSKKGSLIAPTQFREEISQLAKLYKERKPKVILEIGTAYGGTLFMYSKLGVDDALIISVDLPGGSFGGGYPNWKTPLYKSFGKSRQTIELLRMNSHEPSTKDAIKTLLNGRKIDWLFIDGDHSYEGVKQDYHTFIDLLSEKGVTVFHDIAVHSNTPSCQVEKFWNEVKQDKEYLEFFKDKYNQTCFGIRALLSI